jgi:hypothetical protein
MTNYTILVRSTDQDALLSQESEELGRPLRRLLAVGWVLGVSTSITESSASSVWNELASRFQELADTWREETKYYSSTQEMVLNPAYLQIIGMGRDALPFILAELRRQPDHWFWALWAITGGEDPVPPEDKGDLKAMTRHWLQWAERRSIRGAF